MKKDILYLGSQSKHRQKLLTDAGIAYKELKHHSDECGVELEDSFKDYVIQIAKTKMDHLVFPDPKDVETDYVFVLTADSLVRSTQSNQIFGKAKDLDEVRSTLKILSKEPVQIMTGCCLEKRVLKDDAWILEDKIYWATDGTIELFIEEHFICENLHPVKI